MFSEHQKMFNEHVSCSAEHISGEYESCSAVHEKKLEINVQVFEHPFWFKILCLISKKYNW